MENRIKILEKESSESHKKEYLIALDELKYKREELSQSIKQLRSTIK